MATQEQIAWIGRVLQVSISGADQPQAGSAGEHSISPVRLGKCRLVWVKTCQMIASEVEGLKQKIVAEYRNDPSFGPDEIAIVEENVQEMSDWVADLDDTLADLIDDVLTAQPGPERAKAQRAVIAKAKEMEQLVSSNEDIQLLDDNEFGGVKIGPTVMTALSAIHTEMAAAA